MKMLAILQRGTAALRIVQAIGPFIDRTFMWYQGFTQEVIWFVSLASRVTQRIATAWAVNSACDRSCRHQQSSQSPVRQCR